MKFKFIPKICLVLTIVLALFIKPIFEFLHKYNKKTTCNSPYYLFNGFEPITETDIAVIKFVSENYSTAQVFSENYGQPTSVKLAQAINESDAGRSQLARENFNFFGIKCFSRSCPEGHCTNYTDDSHKDFFFKFKTPDDCWRFHSKMVGVESNYKECHNYDDPFEWCDCLKKRGYMTATDGAEKLKNIIIKYHLTDFDKFK